jgi:hypothetical protein
MTRVSSLFAAAACLLGWTVLLTAVDVGARQGRALRRVTGAWPFGDTCLRRCLLRGMALKEEGPVLRTGARRDAHGRFSAHSWLEVDGQSLDPGARDFFLRHAPDRSAR